MKYFAKQFIKIQTNCIHIFCGNEIEKIHFGLVWYDQSSVMHLICFVFHSFVKICVLSVDDWCVCATKMTFFPLSFQVQTPYLAFFSHVVLPHLMDLFNICAIRLRISCTSSFGVLWLRWFCHPDLTAISSLDFASISVISIPENSFLLAVMYLLHCSVSGILKMSGDSNFFWEVCVLLTWSLPYSSEELNDSLMCLLWQFLCCCEFLFNWQFLFVSFLSYLKCVWRTVSFSVFS